MNGVLKTPKLRFTEFKNEWQQKLLEEVLIKNSKKNKNQVINNVQSISNKFGFINQDDYW